MKQSRASLHIPSCFLSQHRGFRGTIKERVRDFVVTEMDSDGAPVNGDAAASRCDRGEEAGHAPPSADWRWEPAASSLDLSLVLGPSVSEQLEQFVVNLRDEALDQKELSLGSFSDKYQRANVHRAVRHRFPFLMTVTIQPEIRVREDPDYKALSQLVSEAEAEDFFRFIDAKVQDSSYSFHPDASKERRTAVHHFLHRRFGKLVETKSLGEQDQTFICARLRQRGGARKRSLDERREQEVYTEAEPGDAGGRQPHGGRAGRAALGLHLRRHQRQASRHLPVHGGEEGVPAAAGGEARGAGEARTRPVARPLRQPAAETRPPHRKPLPPAGPEPEAARGPGRRNAVQPGAAGGGGCAERQDPRLRQLLRSPEVRKRSGRPVRPAGSGPAARRHGGRPAALLQSRGGRRPGQPGQEALPPDRWVADSHRRRLLLLRRPLVTLGFSSGDAKETLALMPLSKVRERLMLRALNRYGSGPEGCTQAWLSLPHSSRLFYPHAYCSRVWNEAASQRLSCLGPRAREGDLVWTRREASGAEGSRPAEVHVVTRQEEEDGVYTLGHVLLPMAGNTVKYPTNIMAAWYRERLARDGLEKCPFRVTGLKLNLPGCYRPLLANMSNLSYSLQSGAEGEEQDGTSAEARGPTLVLNFDLDSSCYATVGLREIMKCDL